MRRRDLIAASRGAAVAVAFASGIAWAAIPAGFIVLVDPKEVEL